jgi:hypothetical protein
MLLRKLSSRNLPAIPLLNRHEHHSPIEHRNLFSVLQVFGVKQDNRNIRPN